MQAVQMVSIPICWCCSMARYATLLSTRDIARLVIVDVLCDREITPPTF